METIAKFIKALFFNEEEADKTAIGKFKNALLWIVLGVGITIGALVYWAGDDDAEEETEYVETYQSAED